MFVRGKDEASWRGRDGLVSRVLLQRGDVAGGGLTVTWVDVAPGSAQRVHDHAPEQVYVLVAGRGLMRVGDEEREAAAGDLVYIPSGEPHGIKNVSGEVLTYVSAATPAQDVEAAYDTGQLRERSGDEGAGR